MIEAIRPGPLDHLRVVNAEAEELDLMLVQAGSEDVANNAVFSEWATELEAVLGLVGQKVEVSGYVLTPSMGEDGQIITLTLPPNKPGVVVGKYVGYFFQNTYSPEQEKFQTRLVHVVETGEHTYTDEFFNRITVKHRSHVCVFGSEIKPWMPYEAHSMFDLQGDEATEALDDIAFAEDLSAQVKIKRITKFINSLLLDPREPLSINQQRVSYLNTLGLLGANRLLTNDLVFGGNRDDYFNGTNIEYSDMGDTFALEDSLFDIAPGYFRLSNGGVVYSGQMALFASGQEDEHGLTIFAPMHNVRKVQPLTEPLED